MSAGLLEMSRKGLGMTVVVDAAQRILGVFTDGDLRRALDKQIDVHTTRMSEVMTGHCKTIGPRELAAEAVHLMELHRITALPVADAHGRLHRRAQRARPNARRRRVRRRSARCRSAIRLVVLDVDGVLTDGRLYFGARGEALKVFHVRDGHGIVELRRAGLEVAVISGRRSPMVRVRCRELGVRHVYQGVSDKLAVLQRLRKRLRLKSAACACVG